MYLNKNGRIAESTSYSNNCSKRNVDGFSPSPKKKRKGQDDIDFLQQILFAPDISTRKSYTDLKFLKKSVKFS